MPLLVSQNSSTKTQEGICDVTYFDEQHHGRAHLKGDELKELIMVQQEQPSAQHQKRNQKSRIKGHHGSRCSEPQFSRHQWQLENPPLILSFDVLGGR